MNFAKALDFFDIALLEFQAANLKSLNLLLVPGKNI